MKEHFKQQIEDDRYDGEVYFLVEYAMTRELFKTPNSEIDDLSEIYEFVRNGSGSNFPVFKLKEENEMIFGIGEENQKLITLVVELNRKLRDERDEHRRVLSPQAFAFEYCSVFYGTGRQTGKTYWIQENAKVGDLIITRKVSIIKTTYKNVHADIMSLIQLNNSDDLPSYNNIFIDVDRFLDSDELGILYKKLAVQNLKQTFIHLG